MSDLKLQAIEILDQLQIPMLFETDGGHQFISENFFEYTGYFSEEVKHNRDFFPARIHLEDMPEFNHLLSEWHKNNESGILYYSFRFKKSNGEYIWIDDYVVQVKDRESKFMRGIMIVVDEEKNREIELRKERFLLEEKGDSNAIDRYNELTQQLKTISLERENRLQLVSELFLKLEEGQILLEELYTLLEA